MSLSIARPLVACVFLVMLDSIGRTEPVSLSALNGITLDDAIAKTLENSPELRSLAYRRDAFEGRIQQAGLAPHPELTVAVEDVMGSGALSGIDSAQTTISIAWVLERGARERRVDAARADAELSAVDAETLQLDLAAETARRFLAMLEFQAREHSVNEAVSVARETVQAVERRVEAGRAPLADLARAQAEHATAKLLREDINHELITARHRLAAQWGALEPDFVKVSGDPFALPEPQPLASLRQLLAQNTDLARYLSKQRLDEAELRLAQARGKPALQARVGVRRLEGTDDQALVAGITVPLTLRNRNQGRIAEAEAVIEQTRAQSEAAKVRMETTLLVLYEALQHSVHRADTLRKEVIPLLESALSETRSAYELGRYGYFEWRTVQVELIEARRELIEASIEAHQNVIEIERLTGVPVSRTGAKQ